MSRIPLLFLNGAILSVCAVFDFVWFNFDGLYYDHLDFDWRTHLLIGLILFLPLLDKSLTLPSLKLKRSNILSWLSITTFALGLIIINPHYMNAAVSTLMFAALPEEWFFRAYFMTRLERLLKQHPIPDSDFQHYLYRRHPALSANILSSSLFALLHIPTQGWLGLSVFFPSLFYGWIYQKTHDLLLVILLHALSNIIFFTVVVPLI